MAIGPRGEERPAGIISAAVMVARLSVGDISETLNEPSGRVRSGHAEGLTAEQRQEIARKAAAARWG